VELLFHGTSFPETFAPKNENDVELLLLEEKMAWNYPLLFHSENDFNGFLAPKNVGKDTKFITPGQIQIELYWV